MLRSELTAEQAPASSTPAQASNGKTALNIAAANRLLTGKSPQDIIRWAVGLGKNTITTTTFGDNSAVLLHMVQQIAPDMPILWVDTGYNTPATYRFSDKLIRQLELNAHIYAPLQTSARRNVLMKGIPDVGDPLHEEFTRQVKLEPFKHAIADLKPEVWITGIQKGQTEFRNSLEVISLTKEGFIKVAPLLHWNEDHLKAYLDEYQLPNEPDYYDPTKAQETRECGLHTRF